MPGEPVFFETPAKFRAWLHGHHATAAELLVGFHKIHAVKRGGAKPVRSMTWPESVAEALCYGWIDGVRTRLDDDRYTIRFTPRKRASTWSAVNIRLAAGLEASGCMTDAGRAAFAARTRARSKTYAYEQKGAGLDAPREREFQRNKPAWDFFHAQPPGYRKKLIWWVISAKQDATRDARLTRLIAASGAGERLE